MKLRYIFTLVLTLLLAIALFACGEDGGDPVESTEPPETEPQPMKLNGFKLVREDLADDEDVARYSKLYRDMAALGEAELTIGNDFIARGEEDDPHAKEILCGPTNRPETAAALEALPGYYDFAVGVFGEKLCVTANTDEGIDEAIAYLLSNLKYENGELVYYGGNYFGCREYPAKDATLGGEAVEKYSIIYKKGDSNGERNAEKLVITISELTGRMLEVKDDGEAEGECEIILGKTSRADFIDPATLEAGGYKLLQKEKKLLLSADGFSGYNMIDERIGELMKENKLQVGYEESGKAEKSGLDGAKVMFVGNSFLYYGYCTTTKNKIVADDQGYFHQVAEEMGDDVYVTSVTYGGKGFKSLYTVLTDAHPNHYGKGGNTDSFYDQDYVILQQEGSNASSTYEYALKIMELFSPDTKFAFFMHHYTVQNNHTNVIDAAEKLRDEHGVIYVPAGHLMYEVWKGKTKVPGAELTYNKNSFVVNHSDSHHPNYLNGYITALSCYYALTGRSIVECPHDFVRTTMEYYTKATSNYDKILASAPDMRGLKQLVEQFVDKYN